MKKLFADLKTRIKARLKALSQNRIVRKQLPFLLFGIFVAIVLSNITPLSSMVFFGSMVVMIIAIVVFFAYSREFMSLRLLFLGASVTSLIFAFHTFFFSLVLNGLVQIPLDAITGLFRSVLLTSLFSLLERITRYIEDQIETKPTKV